MFTPATAEDTPADLPYGAPKIIQIVGKSDCPYCTRAKALLDRMGKSYVYREMNDVAERQAFYDTQLLTANERSVPQIFINGERIGGYGQLVTLVGMGGLA